MIDVRQHILIKVGVAVEASQILHELIDRHWDVQAFCIVVVLIHVQHDDRIRQPEGSVRIGERLFVTRLRRNKRKYED